MGGGAPAHSQADSLNTLELSEFEVLLASEGGSLPDITQLLYRHRGLRSLHTPAAVNFEELMSLRVLSLSHNQLRDIGPIAALPSLQDLNINHNRISDLRPAFACEGLHTLLAADNQVSCLEGLWLQ